MNKINTALAGFSILSLLALLFLASAVSAQTPRNIDNIAASTLAQAATATPEAGVMEHATSTPDANMGMMEHATSTPDTGMMQHTPGATMSTSSSLPATGSSDNSALVLLVAASAALILGGLRLRHAMAQRK